MKDAEISSSDYCSSVLPISIEKLRKLNQPENCVAELQSNEINKSEVHFKTNTVLKVVRLIKDKLLTILEPAIR